MSCSTACATIEAWSAMWGDPDPESCLLRKKRRMIEGYWKMKKCVKKVKSKSEESRNKDRTPKNINTSWKKKLKKICWWKSPNISGIRKMFHFKVDFYSWTVQFM